MEYDANDLIKMWNIQDNFETWAQSMAEAGIKLGAMVFSVEIAKRMLDPRPLDTEELSALRDRSIQIAVTELQGRLGNARGSTTTKE